ncbi:HAD family hydrolase [Phaeacidiphilus oryzae]|uniref:HAD family hydrolase n=1 Tax=Phaeacidiphilus oryzae TaxID=348818 RepID=UPI00068AF8BF|nr:HAD family hydrolase [Phaeacidiphilus oryzae]
MTEADAIADRLRRAVCVLFDFDGPICHLYAERPASEVALSISEALGVRPQRDPDDPHALLRAPRNGDTRAGRTPPAPMHEIEQLITRMEEEAARTAAPTAEVDAVIAVLSQHAVRLAITSNNAPGPIAGYLRRVGLHPHFEDRIFGRRPENPDLMKPDPDCIERALAELAVRESDRSRCLFLGDSEADAAAARQAGVVFLGFVPDRHAAIASSKRELLLDAGAAYVFQGMAELLEAFSRTPLDPT